MDGTYIKPKDLTVGGNLLTFYLLCLTVTISFIVRVNSD